MYYSQYRPCLVLDTANSQWNTVLSINSANACMCVYKHEPHCRVGWDKDTTPSTSDHCIPCLFSIKVMATDYEQNSLLHQFTSVHYSNQVSLWFTTHSVFKTEERKHHLWERDLSSKLWSSDWSHVRESPPSLCLHHTFFPKPPPYTGHASVGPAPHGITLVQQTGSSRDWVSSLVSSNAFPAPV